MGILRFESWCRNAVSDIRDRADRERVYGELYAHMEDQYDELIAQRVEEQKAEKAVVAAMGDAADTARQLERLYPPIWHNLLLAARLVLLLAFLMAVTTVPNYLRNLHDQLLPPPADTLYFGEEDLHMTDGGRDHRVYYTEPMSRDESDGYRFTLTKAAERHISRQDKDVNRREIDSLYLQIEVYHPDLWNERSEILREFYAVDSLGNRYQALNLSDLSTDERVLGGTPHRSGLFSYSWDMWLTGWQHGPEWIEVRYDASGRSVRLRADLKGGGAE